MKFVISLWLVWTSNALAYPIRIYYEQSTESANSIKKILTENYLIPEELISLKYTQKCEVLNLRGKLDLCLKNNGDLLVVSVDRGFISESLKIFHAP